MQMGPHKVDRSRWDWNETAQKSVFCPDAKQAKFFEDYLDGVRKAGSSCGAVIEIVAEGVPAGLGAPVYAKLDGDLAAALMGINAVKGVEIGDGFATAAMSGVENADEMRMGMYGKPVFLSNHAGGIRGILLGRPLSRGSRLLMVAACPPCNHRKGGRTVEQAQMSLLRPPSEPPSSAQYLFARHLKDNQERSAFHQGLVKATNPASWKSSAMNTGPL